MDDPRLPDIHFGEADSPEPEALPEVSDIDEDDDEPLDETPADVVDILGFDPEDLYE